MSCPCCISNYNKGTKTEIKCYFEDCQFSSCKECIRTYLTGTTHEPHCMKCRKKWDPEFVKSSLNSSFMQKEYREHRRNILVERTISQLQEYYPQAVALSQQRKDHQAINKIHAEIDELNKQIHSKYRQISAIRDKTYESGERRKFIMPCQTTDCKGMLSSAYKCDLCEKYTCSKCFESIDGDKDAHICNPDNVETAEEIKKNTRPCPSCGCRISKIDGCFAENTPVLLWNGKIKMSQDICVGDELIGDDGNKRIVEDVFNGQDDLYEIQQNNGDTYIVNSKHTLVLRHSYTNEIIQITVDEYMNLTDVEKTNLHGFKNSDGINYEKQDVLLDPYTLGLWLVDGTHIDYYLLKKYNLFENKHIPDEYLFNDRETRLQLLSGINANPQEFQKTLSEQIIYLKQSLGLMTNCNQNDTPIVVKKIGFGNYYGWNVNDNHRFILKDFTVVKNCDQMWCVECKTAFSWSKGTVEVGQVHNPHYFQWMRQNGGMPRTDQMPGAGCNDNQMHSAFIRDLFDMLYRLSLLEDAFIGNCRNCKYSLDEIRTISPSVYNNYNTILSTMHSDSELLKTKRGIPNDFFVNFYRFIVHTDQITFRDLNRKIRIRNGDNTPILHYILGEETRDNLSEYLVKRDIVNARDGAHRDILEAFIMVGKQIISDMYNELSGIEMEFSWRIISDQIKYMRIGSLTDTKDANTSKMMEFSRFYTQYYLPHKENIEKLYRLCGNISNKYKHSINNYSAYSNLEIIKYLLLYNSKKQVEMWNPDVNNFHVYRFDNKESLIQSMNHFKNQLEKYSRQELKN